MDVYMGLIFMSGLKFTPLYFMSCSGQSITVGQNQALFSLLGTQFGGDGVNTFKLPDMRSVVPIGAGQQPGFYNYVQGTLSGSQAVTLSIANMPAHTHSAAFTGSGGGLQSLTIPAQTGNLSVTAKLPAATTATGSANPVSGNNYLAGISVTASGPDPVDVTGFYTTTKPSTTASLPADVAVTGTAGTAQQTVQYNSGITGGTVAIGATGSGAAVDVRQPALAISFIMATQGTYPMRN